MAGNRFDGIQDTAYSVVVGTMGYVATWAPSVGGPPQSGLVLFNRPTQREDISDEDYSAVSTKMEYLDGIFPGLFDSIQAGGSELITICEIDYYGYKADRKYDGKTIMIQLEPKR